VTSGEFKQVHCERCHRRLFDGTMRGVIRCHWCKWDNRFFEIDDDEKLEYKTRQTL